MIKTLLSVFTLLSTISVHAQYCMTGGPTSTIDSNLESLFINGASGSISYVGCPGLTGVEEYTAQSTVLNAGYTYQLTIQFGTCGNNYPGVGEGWIDYNGDGNFDPSESLFTWSGTPPVALENYIFSVPAGAMNGPTKMRIIQAEGQQLPLDPCATFAWGSVTDFFITIANGVDCSSYIGDDRTDPRIVASLPFSEAHNSGFCYSNQSPAYNSPDVFYLVTPGQYDAINVSLCGSTFDTFLSVQDKYGTVIASNDDFCNIQSELEVLTAGHDTVYVVVEGWGMASGNYTINIDAGSLGNTELDNNQFKIYPNPASDLVQFSENFSGNVELLNTEGVVVISQKVNNTGKLDISQIPPGFYILRFANESSSFDKKLIIQ